MAKETAAAASDDVRDGTIAGRTSRDGVETPTIRIGGSEAPRKGSRIRVRLDNGVVYTAKVAGVTQELLIETEGLEPEGQDQPAPPPSDIVPG